MTQPKRAPRVLFIQQFVPQYDVLLYRMLAQTHGFDVWVAADIETPNQLNQHHTASGVIHVVHQPVISRNGLIRTPGINALVRRVAPDVIIALGNPRYFALPWLMLRWRLAGIPSAAWGMFHSGGPTPIYSRLVFGLLAAAGSLGLAYGKRGADELRWTGLTRKMRIVSTGVDLSACREAMAACPTAAVAAFRSRMNLTGRIVFLQVARLLKSKETAFVVECLSDVVRKFPEVVLALVGDGPERENIARQAESLGLAEHVRLVGAAYEEAELCRWFRTARAVVCGGAIGLLAHHAMAYEVPLIGHDEYEWHGPEAESLVNGSTGLVYRRGDRNALAEAMRFAAENESAMREMGRQGRKNAEQSYSMENKAGRFRDAIIEMMRPAAGREPA